jgi:hypothetical protein
MFVDPFLDWDALPSQVKLYARAPHGLLPRHRHPDTFIRGDQMIGGINAGIRLPLLHAPEKNFAQGSGQRISHNVAVGLACLDHKDASVGVLVDL